MGKNGDNDSNGMVEVTRDQLKFDEYKLIVENTQKMSERRQSATRTYLSVNTAIFVVLGFLVKDGGLNGWYLPIAASPLFISGFIASFTWLGIIKRFQKFIKWRYKQILALESCITDCYQLFTKESKDLFEDKKFCFSKLEALLPIIFMALHSVYFVGMLIYNYLHWCRG